MLHWRVGCHYLDHFDGTSWIFRKLFSVGTRAKIRLGTIVVEIEPWGDDSCSILPGYVLKSGNVCIDC